MGTIKTTNIQSISGSGTVTLGTSGETFTVPSGVTIANSGTATGFGGDLKPAFSAYRGSTQTISDATWTKVQFDTEIYDGQSTYDASTNYRFTPASTGYYLINCNINLMTSAGADLMIDNYATLRENGTEIAVSQNYGNSSSKSTWGQHNLSCIIHSDNTSDYYEIFTYADISSGNVEVAGNATKQFSSFNAFKLIL